MNKIDDSLRTPKYIQLMKILIHDIENYMNENDKLDSEREICEKNGVCIKRSHGYGTQTEKIEFDDIVKIAEEKDISVFEAGKMIEK